MLPARHRSVRKQFKAPRTFAPPPSAAAAAAADEATAGETVDVMLSGVAPSVEAVAASQQQQQPRHRPPRPVRKKELRKSFKKLVVSRHRQQKQQQQQQRLRTEPQKEEAAAAAAPRWPAADEGIGEEEDDDDDDICDDVDALAATLRQRYRVEELSDDDDGSDAAVPPAPSVNAAEGPAKAVDVRGWERCRAAGVHFAVPVVPLAAALDAGTLEAFDDVAEALGNAWRSPLAMTSTEREELLRLLPAGQEFQAAEALFAGETFHFGNPLRAFLAELRAGLLATDVQDLREQHRAMLYKEYLQNVREYHAALVAKATTFRRSLGLDRVAREKEKRRSSKAASSAAASAAAAADPDKTESESSGEEAAAQGALEAPRKRATTTPAQKRSRHAKPQPPEFRFPPSPPFVLFSTLRAIFSSFSGSASFAAVLQHLEKAPLVSCDIPLGMQSAQFLRLALLFLASPPSSSRQFQEQELQQAPIAIPMELVSAVAAIAPPPQQQQQQQQPPAAAEPAASPSGPLVRLDGPDTWVWIERPLREDALQSLEQLFWFALTREQYNEERTELRLSLGRHHKCVLTIEQNPAPVAEDFRRQETERYQTPDTPFEYHTKDGRTVVVAPIKRSVGNTHSKPREHFLLRPDRPSSVNILPLVRDAAARLPGSVGTRFDVATLLRDSQFLVDNVPDLQLQSVVSGALDRLHAERDPCVRFDVEQKLWIYLHRHRTTADFVPTATQQQPQQQQQQQQPQQQTAPPIVPQQQV